MSDQRPTPDSVFVAKSQKGYAAREALFDAAIHLIAEKGIGGFSVSELCNLAGLKRTSFYNYFQTIESLLDELSQREDRNFDENMANAYDEMSHGIQRLSFNLLKYYEIATEDTMWNRFVMEMFANHEATADNMTEDLKCDVVAALDAGDIKIEHNAIDAFTDLVFASLMVVNLQRKAGRLQSGQGQQLVTMILQAANTNKTLIRKILASGPKC